jgi:hypothetical protein
VVVIGSAGAVISIVGGRVSVKVGAGLSCAIGVSEGVMLEAVAVGDSRGGIVARPTPLASRVSAIAVGRYSVGSSVGMAVLTGRTQPLARLITHKQISRV